MNDNGCGWKIFTMLIILALIIFGGPWIVQIAWTAIAVQMFGAPAMPYWTAFFGTWAAHIIFSRISANKEN